MPVSWHGQIGTVVDAVVRREPRRVLDIGVGWGTYGTLIRAAIPDVDLVGVEPWASYRWDHRASGQRVDRWWAYDEVAITRWPPEGGHWFADVDVAVMVDVLEHMDVDMGVAAMRAALDVARALVIATPHDPMRWPQDDHPNPAERHVGRWTVDDIVRLGAVGHPIREAHHLAESIVVVLERGR